MDSLDTICNVLKSIYKRPGMYFVYHYNFESYTSYVGGFLFGMSLIHNIPYSKNLSRAFAEKYNQGQGSNLVLESLVCKVLHENDTDEVKIEKYMSFLIEYFERNDCTLRAKSTQNTEIHFTSLPQNIAI